MAFPILRGLFRYDLIDHYAVLGVPIGADPQKIRERYLKIAYRLHPDTCKGASPDEKQQASRLLSRLINPSYEKLSRESSRSEYLIVLSQTGRSMITPHDVASVESTIAKKLLTVDKDPDLAYFKLLSMLVEHQLEDIENIYARIADISELNLVYLSRKQGAGIRQERPYQLPEIEKTTLTQSPNSTSTHTSSPTPAASVSESAKATSPLETYIRRAQEALDKGNYPQVILEMRDALKLDPKNGRCHGLMGLAYLRQHQISMAKVYVDTALKADPDDPIVRQARQEYSKLSPHAEAAKRKREEESKKTGFWGTMFGDKDR